MSDFRARFGALSGFTLLEVVFSMGYRVRERYDSVSEVSLTARQIVSLDGCGKTQSSW